MDDSSKEENVKEARGAAQLRMEILEKYKNNAPGFGLLYNEMIEEPTLVRKGIMGSIYFDIFDIMEHNNEGTLGDLIEVGRKAARGEDSELEEEKILEAQTNVLRIWMYVREYIRREDPKILALIRSRHEDE